MKRILFFDIDGTLAVPGSEPSPATVEAIRSARRNGHKTVLSTGRPEGIVPDAIRSIGFDAAIYSAGARVAVGELILADHPMDHAMVEGIVSAMRLVSIHYNLECANGAFRSGGTPILPVKSDLAAGSSELRRLTTETGWLTLEEYQGEPVYKVSFQAKSQEQIQRLARELDDAVQLVAFENLVPGVPLIAGEVSDKTVNKGRALELVCAYFGMDPAQAVAFGDSMNDAEMLRAAGLGVAMGNAPEQVKALAGRVCERCEEDGIARELVRLGLAE